MPKAPSRRQKQRVDRRPLLQKRPTADSGDDKNGSGSTPSSNFAVPGVVDPLPAQLPSVVIGDADEDGATETMSKKEKRELRKIKWIEKLHGVYASRRKEAKKSQAMKALGAVGDFSDLLDVTRAMEDAMANNPVPLKKNNAGGNGGGSTIAKRP
ncbi:hypothetical protein HK405_007044, partial [Cladochytrium tenue]